MLLRCSRTCRTRMLLAGMAVASLIAATEATGADAATVRDVGTLPGGTSSVAFAMNVVGQVAGQADTAGATHASR
jgi:uncharacterized membrane protein